jgi:pentatricopeptide repeat protein
MTPEQEEAELLCERTLLKPEDEETEEHLEILEKLLAKPLGRVSHEKLWRTYESLPGRRPRYLNDDNIRRFFRHLSWVEFRDSTNAMQRYLALLDHCNAEDMELSADIWNTAISFTARWIRRTSTDEVKAAVEAWMRMEKAGFEPTNVTFNILFDVAIRAGRYGLADTIFQELVTRKMSLNRFFRTSVIFYAGLQKNGDSVRNAFRDLVNGGEIVDTAVMNCVMLSLIRAGEGAAAENVFARMKELQEQKFGIAGPKSWQAQKELGRFLDHTARSLRDIRRLQTPPGADEGNVRSRIQHSRQRLLLLSQRFPPPWRRKRVFAIHLGPRGAGRNLVEFPRCRRREFAIRTLIYSQGPSRSIS